VSWNPVNFSQAAAEWLSEAESHAGNSKSSGGRDAGCNSEADYAPGGCLQLLLAVFILLNPPWWHAGLSAM